MGEVDANIMYESYVHMLLVDGKSRLHVGKDVLENLYHTLDRIAPSKSCRFQESVFDR